MTFQDILQSFILPIITSGVVVWLFQEWISARLRKGIQYEYDQKLETHKAQLKTESEKSIIELQTNMQQKLILYETARSSFAEGQKSSMERKLDSIEKLWNEILRLKNECPAILAYIDLLTVEECTQMYSQQDARELASEYSNKKIIEYLDIKNNHVEKVRPYIGEYLWSLFFTYRQIMGRIPYLLYMGLKDANKAEWDKDSGVQQILNAVLSENELDEFEKKKIVKLSWLQRKLEAKILMASRKIISGEEFGAASLKQAELILDQITKVEIFEGKNDVS